MTVNNSSNSPHALSLCYKLPRQKQEIIRDAYLVSLGNTLIIPKRHIGSFFETTREEKLALLDYIEYRYKIKLE